MEPITIHNGFITIKNMNSEEYRTFRIRTQPEDSNFAPGSRVVSLLIGPHNTSDYQGFGFVQDNGWITLWRKKNTPVFQGLAKAVRLASKALEKGLDTFETPKATYSVELSKHCRRCNRVLTTPESLSRGYGPECAKYIGG